MQIINVNQVKKQIDTALKMYGNRYIDHSDLQLYSFCSIGEQERLCLIFLFTSCSNAGNFLYSDSIKFLKRQTFYNHDYVSQKLFKLVNDGNFIIKPFNGEIPSYPYQASYNFVPFNDLRLYLRIIDYIAAGYAKEFDINPNLISSLGYSVNYETI